MERPLLAPRAEQPSRCAYCHADAPEPLLGRCDGCGALTHPECREAGCPTLGCAQASYVPPRAQLRPDRIRRKLSAAERALPSRWECLLQVLVSAVLIGAPSALLGQTLTGGQLRGEWPRPEAYLLAFLGAGLSTAFMLWLQRRRATD